MQPFAPDFRSAYIYQYNLNVQRQLPGNLLLELAYVGSSSYKLNRERQINIAPITFGSSYFDINDRRIYQNFSDIFQQESTGRARYDAGQARVTRRFSKGVYFDASYVYSRSFDNGTSPDISQSPFTDPFEWARSNNDSNHNFVASVTYDLPNFKAAKGLNWLVNGWQIGAITEARSGYPLDIRQFSFDPRATGFLFSRPNLVGKVAKFNPRDVRTIEYQGIPYTGNFYIDPNAFEPVLQFFVDSQEELIVGNLGRNAISGPGFKQTSMSFVKRIKFAETQSLEMRLDATNIFNQANFILEGDLDVGNPLIPYTALRGRNMQISVRYTF